MAKKSSMVAAIVVVLAFAVPAVASAGSITSSPGVLMKVGEKLTGTSTNFLVETPLGKLECKHVEAQTELTANSGGTAKMKGTGEGTAKGCTLNGKEVKEAVITHFKIIGVSIGFTGVSVEETFEAHLPSGLTCHFEGDPAGVLSVGGSHITIGPGASLKATPAACGSALMRMTLNWRRALGGTEVIFD